MWLSVITLLWFQMYKFYCPVKKKRYTIPPVGTDVHIQQDVHQKDLNLCLRSHETDINFFARCFFAPVFSPCSTWVQYWVTFLGWKKHNLSCFYLWPSIYYNTYQNLINIYFISNKQSFYQFENQTKRVKYNWRKSFFNP